MEGLRLIGTLQTCHIILFQPTVSVHGCLPILRDPERVCNMYLRLKPVIPPSFSLSPLALLSHRKLASILLLTFPTHKLSMPH